MIWVADSGWWGTTAEAVDQFAGQQPEVSANLVNVWRYRGKVRWRKVQGRVWVCLADVADAERTMSRMGEAKARPSSPPV